MLIGAGIAYAAVKQITPQFRSQASIMLDIRDQNVINLGSVLSDTPLNRELLESELLVIKSDPLLEQVVNKLRLDLDPEYNPSMAQPSEMAQLISEKKSAALSFLGLGAYDTEQSHSQNTSATPVIAAAPEARQRANRRRAVGILRGKLKARQLSPAYAIQVQVVSANPVKAALIANAIAEQYVADQLEAKFSAARRATAFLEGRLEQLRARVEVSATAVQEYTTVNQTGASQAVAITQQQIAQLSAELINARAERAQAQAKFDQARRTVDQLGAAGAASVFSSPLIISLRGQAAELTRNEAELSNRYGPKHPTMIQIRNELKDVNRAIIGEVRQILNGLDGDIRVAAARVAALTDGLTDLENKASGQSEASVGLNQLAAEADANRALYDSFLIRLNETREQESFQTPDSRVIQPANPAFAPFMPRSKVTTALGGIAGGAVGFGLVVLMRLLDRSVRTPASITERTGLTVLAGVPRMRRRHIDGNMLKYLINKPNSELAEAGRYLRNSITMNDGHMRSVMITSALPREGKMTMAVLLAEMSARANQSVLLIDADFRRPSIAKTLKLNVTNDLVTLLQGHCSVNEAIYRGENALFDTIPLHEGQGAASDLLALPRMKALITALSKQYDLVLIEGPPVLGVGDFSVLGRIVDTSVMVVEWNRTSVAAVERAYAWLQNHQVPVLGAILNKIDPRRASDFDPVGYGAEYSAIQQYYLN